MKGGVHTAQRHDSALKHATGQAVYIDDMPEPPGTLHGALVMSPVAHGRLRKVEVPSAPGVVAVLGPNDIPGRNDVAAVGKDEPLFATDRVFYSGQPLLLVVATSLDAARHAAEKAVIEIDEEPAIQQQPVSMNK